ncbi:hypothetical protein D9M71_506070 [compost metagenome]
MNHFLCQLDNFYRFTHVEYKNISTLSHRASLDHQLSCFRDGHEVASYLRVRDRQRPSGLDLLMEQRNDRPGRSEYISKTNHGETGFIHLRYISCITEQYRSQLPAQCLQRHFSQALSAAHYICRAYCLVCRNQHKIGNARLQRRLRCVERTHDIVKNPLCNIVFDHWYMFIGRSVIDRFNAPCLQNVEQFCWVTYRTKNW